MRPILESYPIAHLLRRDSSGQEQTFGPFQTMFHNPPLRRKEADFGKIALEGGQTTPCIGGKLFETELFGEILLHEIQEVDFPHLIEIEQGRIEPVVEGQQTHDSLLYFQLQPLGRRSLAAVGIRQKRIEQTLQRYGTGQHVHRLTDGCDSLQPLAATGYTRVILLQLPAGQRQIDSPVGLTVERYLGDIDGTIATNKDILPGLDLLALVATGDDQLARTHEDDGVRRHAVLHVHVAGNTATQQDISVIDQTLCLFIHVTKIRQNDYYFGFILRNISGMAEGFIGIMSTRSSDLTMCSVPCL